MRHLEESAEFEIQNALDIGNAPVYFDLCKQLDIQGKDIRDPRLYDTGRQLKFDFSEGLEKAATEEEIKPILKKSRRRVKYETYVAFLDEAEKIGPGNVSGMRKTLFKYFGYKFSPYGTTPLRDTGDIQVMGMFHGHVRYAKRRIVEETK